MATNAAGELHVRLTHGEAGKPSRVYHTLFTSSGGRYALNMGGSLNQWRTGQRIQVKGKQRAAAALPMDAPSIMPTLDVTEVVEVVPVPSAPRASSTRVGVTAPTYTGPGIAQVLDVVPATGPSLKRRALNGYTGPVFGNAPVNMTVLFIVITMCDQPASITPAVSCDLGRAGVSGICGIQPNACILSP